MMKTRDNTQEYIDQLHDDYFPCNEHEEERYERDCYDDYSYDDSMYDACDGMEDAYRNID